MKSQTFAFCLALAVALPHSVLALSFEPADFYNDVRAAAPESAGVNLLTRQGIVQGFAPRMFGMSRTINRAEFLKVAMLTAEEQSDGSLGDCFPDVGHEWFASFVCAAHAKAIIGGFVDGYFHPENTVTYGEALKMLTLLFGYEVKYASGHWAEGYYRAAASRGVDLPMTIDLDHPLTRGQAVRLAAAFFAEEHGALQELRLAESGNFSDVSSSSSISSSVSSMSSSSLSSSSSMSSSVTTRPLDPIADTTIRSQFLLLGEMSSVIGAAKIFIEEEPVDFTAIGVNIFAEVPSVQSLLVYDDDNRYLGRATLNTSSLTNRNYRLTIAPGTFQIGKREERTLYFRAQLSPFNSGGTAGQTVEISNVVIEGNGIWSSEKYTKQSSGSNTFLPFVTSRSTITSVENALDPSGALFASTNQLLASFTFTGKKSDSTAHIDLRTLVFQIEQTGDVALENVKLKSQGIPDGILCNVTSSLVTCSAIPDQIGSLSDEPRTLQLYGDVILSDALHGSLRLTLNQAGDPQNAGAISWNDGSVTFHWVSVDSPIASGTSWSY